jgi:phosphate transport system substrate-binding protein
MPPEVRIALEEQQYICEDGAIKVQFPQAISDIATDFSDSLASACSSMSISTPKKGESAQIVFSSNDTFTCTPFLKVPFAQDGALIIVNEPDLSSLNLDFATASKIFDGQITSWDDPAIAALNKDQQLPSVPISVFPSVAREAMRALQTWATSTGNHFDGKLLKPIDNFTDNDAAKIKDNQIAIFPYSVNMQEGLIAASIIPDSANPKNIVASEGANLASAGTQWVTSVANGSVSVTLDAKLKPTAPQGIDVAPTPYQAVYPVYMGLCGSDSLPARAVARFLLRQDSQGSLGASNLIPLAEPIRFKAIEAVAVGLPKVKINAPAN